MSLALQVFVSSACHELRDLRASIRTWLVNLGLTPVLSDEGGFPNVAGMPPYAACLQALEECPLVIGIIDRYYGKTFDDWGAVHLRLWSLPPRERASEVPRTSPGGPAGR